MVSLILQIDSGEALGGGLKGDDSWFWKRRRRGDVQIQMLDLVSFLVIYIITLRINIKKLDVFKPYKASIYSILFLKVEKMPLFKFAPIPWLPFTIFSFEHQLYYGKRVKGRFLI
jgi:hypothetical protein